jgi:DNA-binding PadR family transcriptional regulator
MFGSAHPPGHPPGHPHGHTSWPPLFPTMAGLPGAPGFPGDPGGGMPPPPPPPYPPEIPPGAGPGFFGPGPLGHGPFGPGPKVKKGDVRAAALALLIEGPRNGYQIIQEITERSHGIWRPSPGSVYPALQQLEDEGLVRAKEEGGRRTYHLTDEGRAHVAEHRDTLTEPWAEVAESVSEELVDLRGLLFQVGMAVRQVMAAGTSGQHGEARKLLADTRRALYRLLADDPKEDR